MRQLRKNCLHEMYKNRSEENKLRKKWDRYFFDYDVNFRFGNNSGMYCLLFYFSPYLVSSVISEKRVVVIHIFATT